MVQRPMALDNDGGDDSRRRNNPLMHFKSRPRKVSNVCYHSRKNLECEVFNLVVNVLAFYFSLLNNSAAYLNKF